MKTLRTNNKQKKVKTEFTEEEMKEIAKLYEECGQLTFGTKKGNEK